MLRDHLHLHHVIPVAVISLSAALGVNCSGSANHDKTELDAPGIEATPAQGWAVLNMNAYNYADTELDSLGHFKTVPNGCHQDAAGAIDVKLWNRISHDLNVAAAKAPLSDDKELCFEHPPDSKLYGTVDLMLDPSTHMAFTAENQPHPEASWPFPWPWETHTPEPSGTVTPTPTVTHSPHPSPSPSSVASPSPSPSPSYVKRTILEERGGQICTTINDIQTAKDLVGALDALAAIAYKEDCERVP